MSLEEERLDWCPDGVIASTAYIRMGETCLQTQESTPGNRRNLAFGVCSPVSRGHALGYIPYMFWGIYPTCSGVYTPHLVIVSSRVCSEPQQTRAFSSELAGISTESALTFIAMARVPEALFSATSDSRFIPRFRYSCGPMSKSDTHDSKDAPSQITITP